MFMLACGSHAAAQRLHRYVGGPYKIAAVDVTGDKFVDVVLGYHMVGVVVVEEGNGRGGLSPLPEPDRSPPKEPP